MDINFDRAPERAGVGGSRGAGSAARADSPKHRVFKRPRSQRLGGLATDLHASYRPSKHNTAFDAGRTSPFPLGQFGTHHEPEVIDLTDDADPDVRVANSPSYDPDGDVEMTNADDVAVPSIPTPPRVPAEDDDDVVEIVSPPPRLQQTEEDLLFNQPAPVPHFGPGDHEREVEQIKKQEFKTRIRLLRNEIIQNQNTFALKQEERRSLLEELGRLREKPSHTPTELQMVQQLVRRIQNFNAEVHSLSNAIHQKEQALQNCMESTPEGLAQLERRRRRKEKLQRIERELIEKERSQREQQLLLQNSTSADSEGQTSNGWGLSRLAEIPSMLASRFHSIQPALPTYNFDLFSHEPIAPDMHQDFDPYQHAQTQGYSSNIYSNNENMADTKDLQELMNNIQTEENEDEQEYSQTPPELAVSLLKHQRMGLSWILRMEASPAKGSILADDMGLGKTIQALALMVAHKSTDPNCKTTLVVGPVSLLRQWAAEIDTKIKPEFALSVGFYHGATKAKLKTFKDLAQYDVMLTSYPTLQSEWKKHYSEAMKNARVTKNKDVLPDPNAGGEVYRSPFFSKDATFYRIILDEAHSVKNKLSQSSKAVATLKAEYRLCLTGTPMQNSVDELYPILRFLKIRPYCDETKFKSHISVPLKSQNNEENYEKSVSIKRLRALLKAVLLRRSKDSKIDGEPILNLPKKHILDDYTTMSEAEYKDYKSMEKDIQFKAKKLLKSKKVNNFSNILVLLLRLRQTCCHIFLSQLGEMKAESYRAKKWSILYNSVLRLDEATHFRMREELQIVARPELSSISDNINEVPEDDLGNLSEAIERLSVSTPPSPSLSPRRDWTAGDQIEVVHLDDSDTEETSDFEPKSDAESLRESLVNAITQNDANSGSINNILKDVKAEEIEGNEMLHMGNTSTSIVKHDTVKEEEKFNEQIKVEGKELEAAFIAESNFQPTNGGWYSGSASGVSSKPYERISKLENGATLHLTTQSVGLKNENDELSASVSQSANETDFDDSDLRLEDDQSDGIFTCPICFNAVSAQQIIGFPCKHKVCEECVDEFFLKYEVEHSGFGQVAKCYSCEAIVKETELVDYKLYHMIHNQKKTKEQIRDYFKENYDGKGKQANAQKLMRLIKENNGFEPSAKMIKLLELLKDILSKDRSSKIIIFSQFTMYLDLLKMMLNQEKIGHLRYDGTMSIDQKDVAVRKFYSSQVPVMLISLRAGNVGLTLTCASHVVIMDPFWNPFVEEQAMDRAHRIGQQREVFVHRILVNNTIEERIIALQTNKKELIAAALDEGGMKNISSLNRRELGFLFGLNEL